MTRQEFIDDITSWSDYFSFCDENGYDGYTESLYWGDTAQDSAIEGAISMLRDGDISSATSFLNDLPYFYEDEVYSDYDGWQLADFDGEKQSLLEALDDDNFFDQEDDEDDEEIEMSEERKLEEECENEIFSGIENLFRESYEEHKGGISA